MSGFLGGALARRSPTWLLLLGLVVVGLVRLVVAVWRIPWGPAAALVLGVVAYVWLDHGWLVAVVMVLGWLGGLALVFGLLLWRNPDALRSWRRGRLYRRVWADAMGGCGLVRDGIEPTLMSCRTEGGVDRLHVHRAPGQLAADWREVAPRLASALGVRSVRVRESGPRDVTLLVRWREIRRRDPEVLDDAAVEAEVTEVTEQLVAERGAFPRRPR